jgi:hypothetical protein
MRMYRQSGSTQGLVAFCVTRCRQRRGQPTLDVRPAEVKPAAALVKTVKTRHVAVRNGHLVNN